MPTDPAANYLSGSVSDLWEMSVVSNFAGERNNSSCIFQTKQLLVLLLIGNTDVVAISMHFSCIGGLCNAKSTAIRSDTKTIVDTVMAMHVTQTQHVTSITDCM